MPVVAAAVAAEEAAGVSAGMAEALAAVTSVASAVALGALAAVTSVVLVRAVASGALVVTSEVPAVTSADWAFPAAAWGLDSEPVPSAGRGSGPPGAGLASLTVA